MDANFLKPTIKTLKDVVPYPDFAVFNGFLQQSSSDAKKVIINKYEYEMDVPRLPAAEKIRGMYQIWGGTQPIIDAPNEFNNAGGNNIAYMTSLLTGTNIGEHFQFPPDSNIKKNKWNATSHTSLQQYLNNPTSGGLHPTSGVIHPAEGQIMVSKVISKRNKSIEKFHINEDIHSDSSGEIGVINLKDRFPKDYPYNPEWQSALFEEQLIISDGDFDHFLSQKPQEFFSEEINVLTSQSHSNDPALLWKYEGSPCRKPTKKGYELPCGGGGFYVYGQIIDKLNSKRNKSWNATNPDVGRLTFFNPRTYRKWSYGDFSDLSASEKERLDWIRSSALYFDKYRKAKISMIDDKTYAFKIYNQFEAHAEESSQRLLDSLSRDSMAPSILQDSGGQNLF